MHSPNISIPNFIKQTLMDVNAHINHNTIIVSDYNTPLLPIEFTQTKPYRNTWIKWYSRSKGPNRYL